MRRPLFVLALVVCLAVGSARAGSLSGVVTSPQGQPLPQVVLRLIGDSASRTIVSGAAGRYHIELPAGHYRMQSLVPGFLLAIDPAVHVGDADSVLDILLAPAAVREHVLVAAERGDAPSSSVGATTTVLDADHIAARQATSLAQLLQDVPGIAINRAGPLGQATTLFVRGGNSNDTRVIVDGVPTNEPGGFLDLGNNLAVGVDQVEIVRGAASSLYGTDALAGVLDLSTRRPGAGEPVRGRLSADAGSFSAQRYQGALSGTSGVFDWNAAALRLRTDNDTPNTAFREDAAMFALGARLSHDWSIRWTGRGADSRAGTPGQTVFGAHDEDAYFDRTDRLTSLRLSGGSGNWTHELRAGLARSEQLSVDPLDSGSFTPTFAGRVGSPISDFVNAAGYQNDTQRTVAGYKTDYQALAHHLVTAGVDVEHETGDLGTRGEPMLSPSRTNTGVYAQDRWTVTDACFVTAGARVEHNDSFGTVVVPRGAIHLRVAESAGRSTQLRASAGGGVKEPGFFESFGTSPYAHGNAALKPERSRTWDLGVEQRAFGDRLRLALTGYRHDYVDQISYTSDPVTYLGTWVNLGKTRAQGIELEMEAQPRRGLRLLGQYTYLHGEVLVSNDPFSDVNAVGRPLLRRPKHSASIGAQYEAANGRWSAGATLVHVGARADSDFEGLGLTVNEGYTRLDARARLRLERRFELFAIGENVGGTTYQEVLGYPALGRSVRVGIAASTGR